MIHKLNDIHFTSNLHFRNKEVAVSRGFENVEAMEVSLIDQWNKQIKPDDTVYILGGFCSIAKGALQSYMNLVYELNGSKHFILSSDDHMEPFEQMMTDPNLGVVSVSNYKEVKFLNQKIVLMHYPLLDWSGRAVYANFQNPKHASTVGIFGHRGSIHLHGGRIESDLPSKRINISFEKEKQFYTAFDLYKKVNLIRSKN